MENNSKVYFNGSVWSTNNYGKIVIIEKLMSEIFLGEFDDGTIIKCRAGDLKRGKIKNPNFPNVYNIGCLGVGVFCPKDNKKEYSTWKDMLKRCYCKKYLANNTTYKNCTTDSRWYNFQNFCEDIKQLENYNKWLNGKPREYDLDKDFKFNGNKIYSKNTCTFLKKKDNVGLANKSKITGFTYLGTRILDGYQETFMNQSEFCRKYNLLNSMVCKCIKGERGMHRGWRFDNTQPLVKNKLNK